MPRLLAGLAALLAISACSHRPASPTVGPTAGPSASPAFPEPGSARLDTLSGQAVVPFDGRAGQALALHMTGEATGPLSLCLTSAEAWARITAEGEVQAPPPDDLAGDGLTCADARPSAAPRVTLAEVLPRDGAYVLVAQGEGPVRIEGAPGPGPAAPLTPGRPHRADLAAPSPWGAAGAAPLGVHFVRGRKGERLTVTVDSAAFSPYTEVGAWAGGAYTPLVGNAAQGATAQVQLRLPADGLYTVRVTSEGAGTGPYSVRADVSPEEDWALRFPSGGDPAERYALIASVADYPGLGGPPFQDDLSGPRADADRVRRFLVDERGFRPENVVVLHDADVTREALAEGFRRHLGQAGPGGTALFHYAGHGVQVPAEALDHGRAEADGYDEALAVWGHGDAIELVLDHELGALAEALPAEHVVLVLDNCHSGDGSRGDGPPGGAIRRLDYGDVGDRIVAPQSPLGGANAGAEHHVLLSAARAEQPSLELDGLAPDGGRAGVFTTALVEALRAAGPADSFRDVVDRLRPDVERQTAVVMDAVGYQPQSPQVEGAQADRPVSAALGAPADR